MNYLTNLITKISQQKNLTNKLIFFAFIVLGIVAFFTDRPSAPSKDIQLPNQEKAASVDTYIPKGFVLVPLELVNANSLGSLVGDMGGVVDLYFPQAEKPSIKVASQLKILRAPLNPEMYAVLVPENESSRILNYSGPFLAVVQNPQSNQLKVISKKVNNFSIEYQN